MPRKKLETGHALQCDRTQVVLEGGAESIDALGNILRISGIQADELAKGLAQLYGTQGATKLTKKQWKRALESGFGVKDIALLGRHKFTYDEATNVWSFTKIRKKNYMLLSIQIGSSLSSTSQTEKLLLNIPFPYEGERLLKELLVFSRLTIPCRISGGKTD